MSGSPSALNPAHRPILRPAADAALSSDRAAVVVCVAVFATLSVAAAVLSAGFLEADACTHYLYSRFCLEERHLLLNVWGRPFCTAIYAVPAALGGRLGVRLASLLIAVAIGLVTRRIAQNQGYRFPGLALVFLLGQPLVFLHSFSELTELPFALLVALAFWAYQCRRWPVFALLVGLMPTARPEGFGFIALAGLALLMHRRWRWLPVLVLPLAVWSVAGWAEFGYAQPWYTKMFTWLPENWPYADKSLYDSGHILHFIFTLPAVVSPFVFPVLWLGLWRSLHADGAVRFVKSPGVVSLTVNRWDHVTRCQWLVAVLPLLVLAGHSVLYWAGRMASNGELRYMLVVAPFWALLVAKGWEWVWTRCRLTHPYRWAGLAVLLALEANQLYKVVPLQLTKDWVRARDVAQWYKQQPFAEKYPYLMATHTGLFYFLDVSPTNWSTSVEWGRKTLTAPPDGVLAIWDPIYGLYNADASRTATAAEMVEYGWVPVHVFPREVKPAGDCAIGQFADMVQKDEVGDWIVFLSPRDAAGNHTDPALTVPMPTPRPRE